MPRRSPPLFAASALAAALLACGRSQLVDGGASPGAGGAPVATSSSSAAGGSGEFGEGPPHWFPDWDPPCPDDLNELDAQRLLEESVEGRDNAHPNRKARYAIDEKGASSRGTAKLPRTESSAGTAIRSERT